MSGEHKMRLARSQFGEEIFDIRRSRFAEQKPMRLEPDGLQSRLDDAKRASVLRRYRWTAYQIAR
jgi:hypothetical protein